MTKLTISLLFVSLILFYSPAYAQTPDGQPPAQEDVCDGQVGAAYGLCNAYCEAMDCDSAEAQASDMACDKVLERFLNITGVPLPQCTELCPDGSVPPCEV